MAHLAVLDTGIIYRNPLPHLRSRHAYFPSVLELAPGRMVAGFDVGSAFEAVDVRSFVSTSEDGGRSWSEPNPIFLPQASQAVSTSCRLSRVNGSDIVGLACINDRSREDHGLANPQTDGFVRTDFALLRSEDGGRSFSSPEPITPPLDWHHFEICSPIIPTGSGRWLAPTSIWPDWSGRDPFGPKAIAFISDNQGKSWNKATDVMARRDGRIAFFEQKIISLSDGSLFAICWTVDLNSKQNLSNHYAVSTDDGDTFSEPTKSPLMGETCTPVALDDHHLLCVYRRLDKKGLWAHLAKLERNQWQPVAELPLWGSNVIAHETTQQSLLSQMSTLRFGCPSVARLADGTIFIAFWCVEECVSNIRWFRISVR